MVQPDRQKIRKGTKSCWECKRRKARCIFTGSSESCAGCRRRGTQCIGQERPDPGHLSQPGDRLARIESLLDELLDRISGNSHLRLDSNTSVAESRDSIITTNILPKLTGTTLPPLFISPSTIPNQTSARHDKIRNALLEAWPSDADIEIILCNSIQLENSSHGLVSAFCTPELDPKTARQQRLSRRMLQLPPSGSHPVLYARKLMILGSCLQVTSPCPPSDLSMSTSTAVNFDELMFRAVETARTLVNSNDEMVGSIEGIECISMEAMYHAYTGDIHRAWLTLRRAILIAQTMGLHRGIHPPSITTAAAAAAEGYDQSSSESIQQLWFNLIHLDRFLSLMIGLPQSSSESPFATPSELEACREPEERLRRLDCASAGRILEHREKNTLRGYDETMLQIDSLLQEAAACMPARWWLHQHQRHSSTVDEEEAAVVLNQHVRHYHLLAQLHWPSLLSSLSSSSGNNTKDSNHEYSKLTAINASRQALSCYIALANTSPSAVYHSPSLNHIGFMASTALCLAYLDVNNKQKRVSSAYAASFTTHQRQTDRGMMEQALESMQCALLGRLSSDTTSVKIRDSFQRLLDIDDAASSRGIKYCFRLVDSSSSSSSSFSSSSNNAATEDNGSDGLQIHIPPYETIVIERCTPSHHHHHDDTSSANNIDGTIDSNLTIDNTATSPAALLSSYDYHMADDLTNMLDLDFDILQYQ